MSKVILGASLTILCLAILLLSLMGCDTPPYTNPLFSIDDVLKDAGDNVICIEDGFDSVCAKLIPGINGKDGADGKDAVCDGADIRNVRKRLRSNKC
jgi:hypothetical protein